MKKLIYLLPLITFCIIGLWGCEEDEMEAPRLFRPNIVSYLSKENTLTFSWIPIANATTYVIELSRDVTFEAGAEYSEMVEETKYTFTGLLYDTGYYVRLKAVSNGTIGDSNWTTKEEEVKTQVRVVPNLLQAIEPTDIGEDYVTLRWGRSEAFPVDSIAIVQVLDETAAPIEILLTEEQIEAGSLYVDNLQTNVVYRATVCNTKASIDAKTYNSREFKTVGPPAEAKRLEADDNFAQILEDDLKNAALPELVYYLPAGANYYMFNNNALELDENGKVIGLKGDSGRGYTITKSVRILGAPGAQRPTLWMRGAKWEIMNNIDFFDIDGVNLKEYTTASSAPKKDTYFINQNGRVAGTGALTIDQFSIKNSDIAGFRRGIFMCNNANAEDSPILVNNIIVDNCIYEVGDDSVPHEGMGMFQIRGAYTDIWNNISITNSTFYNCPGARGLFGQTSASTYCSRPEPGRVNILNCTFFDFSTANTIIGIDVLPAPSVTLTLKNCLVATTGTNKQICPVGNSVVTSEGNYYVEGWLIQKNDNHLNFVSAGVSVEELFVAPSEGNLEIKDKESDVYKYGIGDPRWIK